MLNRAPDPPNGHAPDHPGSYRVFIANEAARRRERLDALAGARPAAEAGPAPTPPTAGPIPATEAQRRAEDARWAAARQADEERLAEASRRIAETGGGLAPPWVVPPPTSAGFSIPTPRAVAEHAVPEQPRAAVHPITQAPDAPADPLDYLRMGLRPCERLDQAAEYVRRFAVLEPGRLCPELIAQLDRAEQLWRVHHDAYLAEMQRTVRAHAIEALRLAGLWEFAAAIESGDFARILEGLS